MLGTRHLGKVDPGKELGTEVGAGEDWGLAGGGWFGRGWVRKRFLEFLGERKLDKRPQRKLIVGCGEGGSLKE